MKSCENTGMKQAFKLVMGFLPLLGILLQPVYGAADEVIVPEGTHITLQLNKTLSTKTNREGEEFDTYVIAPVYSQGQIVIPKGSTVSGSISRITRPGRFQGKAVMHLLFQSIHIPGRGELPIHATLARIDSDTDADIHTEGTLESKSANGKTVGKVIAPGLVGAGAGTLAGGRKGAAIGSGIGIGIGLVNVFWTRGKDLELRRGSSMDITLEQALIIVGSE